jgi:hypothetical protein
MRIKAELRELTALKSGVSLLREFANSGEPRVNREAEESSMLGMKAARRHHFPASSRMGLRTKGRREGDGDRTGNEPAANTLQQGSVQCASVGGLTLEAQHQRVGRQGEDEESADDQLHTA